MLIDSAEKIQLCKSSITPKLSCLPLYWTQSQSWL